MRGSRARRTATHAAISPATATGTPMRNRRCPPTHDPIVTSRNAISAARDAADVFAGMTQVFYVFMTGRNRSKLAAAIAPQAKAAGERLRVVADADARRQLAQEFRIAATDDDLFHLERGLEPQHHVAHGAAPLLLAEPLQSALANVLLVGAVFLVRQMGELHRLE